jgi:hypothetical protein
VRRLRSMIGKTDATPSVVHLRAPVLRTALSVVAGLVLLFAFYVVYELGRYNAGYDRQLVAQQRTELEVQIEKLERSNREMRTKLAEADTVQMGRSQEQATLARTVGDLQAQVARQSQELAFYRGVVAQNAAAIGVKIEQLHVTPGTRPNSFVVHLSLVRSGRADTDATGSVQMNLDGSSPDGAKSLELQMLTGGKVRELRYSFKYLQNFEQEISFPAALKPEQLVVEVQSNKRDVAPLSQTFLWSVESTP